MARGVRDSVAVSVVKLLIIEVIKRRCDFGILFFGKVDLYFGAFYAGAPRRGEPHKRQYFFYGEVGPYLFLQVLQRLFQQLSGLFHLFSQFVFSRPCRRHT